jgi:hypothetical protein
MSSGTFAAFSKFHRNTSKSTNMKVVQFDEGHNFHVDWHFQFRVEKAEKRGQLSASPVHRDMVTFRVWLRIVHKAFVEVVEDSEIYNFAIYPSMHCSSSFGRKTWSK